MLCNFISNQTVFLLRKGCMLEDFARIGIGSDAQEMPEGSPNYWISFFFKGKLRK